MHGFMIRFLILWTQGGRSWSTFENTLDVVQDKLEFKKMEQHMRKSSAVYHKNFYVHGIILWMKFVTLLSFKS